MKERLKAQLVDIIEEFLDTPSKTSEPPTIPKNIFIDGKTPEGLYRVEVQTESFKGEASLVMGAYTTMALYDPPASFMAVGCETHDEALALVAELHRALVDYLVTRHRRRRLLVELFTFALYCRHKLRFEMLQDDHHREMFTAMEETVADAKVMLAEDLSQIYTGDALRLAKQTKGGSHDAEPDQKPVSVRDAEMEAPGPSDSGAHPIMGDRPKFADPCL